MRKQIAGVVLATALGLGVTGTAFAGTKTSSSSISCDGTTTKSLAQVNTTATGTYSIKVNSATQESITGLYAVSQNGNALSTKNASAGQTVSWTSVAAATYTAKGKRVGSRNCNGILLGNGNYTLDYTITYVG